MFSLLISRLRGTIGGRQNQRAKTASRQYRPRLESLEPRQLLTTTLFDFQELAHNGDSVAIGPYSSAGYLITTSVSNSDQFKVFGPQSAWYAGSAALMSHWAPTTIRLSRPDAEPFAIESIGLSRHLAGWGAFQLTFTGTHTDNSTVSHTFTVDSFGFKTYVFPSSFSDLELLTWHFTGTSDYHQFDNVKLIVGEADPPPPPPPNSVPVAANDSYAVDEDGVLDVILVGESSLSMVSDVGDWVGQGKTYDLTSATGDFRENHYSNPRTVSIHYENPRNTSDYWNLDFDAPGNELLVPGTYLSATRYPFNDIGPGLSVTGQHRGCNTIRGEFVVHQVAFDTAGDLTSFHADFEQHCEGFPAALRGTIHYGQTGVVVGSVLANDTDADGDSLAAVLASEPLHGIVTLGSDGSFLYTPAADFSGTDSFTYSASDGKDLSSPATVTITVRPRPDAPVVDDKTFSLDENGPAGTIAGNVGATDIDGGILSYSLSGGNGAFAIDSQGNVFVADSAQLDYETTTSFTVVVQVTDAEGLSDTANVTINLNPVNEAPVIDDQTLPAVSENSANGTAVGSVVADDVDGDALSYAITGGSGQGAFSIDMSGGIVVLDSGRLDFEAQEQLTLEVRVTDAAGLSDTAVVTIPLQDVLDTIDVVPGDATNTIDLRSGEVGIAILSTARFDATSAVIVSSLRFGRTGDEDSLVRHPKRGPKFEIVDVNGDGRLDLVAYFKPSATGLQVGDTQATLTGQLSDGSTFAFQAKVAVVQSKGNKQVSRGSSPGGTG